MISVFGRTAFFYYIVHLYLIHFLATISFYLNGHSVKESIDNIQSYMFYFIMPGEGYNYLEFILFGEVLF